MPPEKNGIWFAKLIYFWIIYIFKYIKLCHMNVDCKCHQNRCDIVWYWSWIYIKFHWWLQMSTTNKCDMRYVICLFPPNLKFQLWQQWRNSSRNMKQQYLLRRRNLLAVYYILYMEEVYCERPKRKKIDQQC